MALSNTNDFEISVWPIDGDLINAVTLGQSGSGSDGNKEVLYTHQSSRTLAIPSDAVYCHTQDTSHSHKLWEV